MRKKISLTITVLAVLGLFAAHVQAAPTVTITSPADGDTISRGANPTFTMAGGVSFDTPAPTTTRYFARRAACGGTADQNMRLSTTSGTDGGTGCGYIGGWNLLGTADEPGFAMDFPAENGVPLTLDAGRAIATRIIASSYQGIQNGPVGIAAGQATMTATLTADGQPLGSQSVTQTILPTTVNYTYDFSFTAPAGLDKRDFGSLSLRLTMRGPGFGHGYVVKSGASYVDLPTYTASFDRRVQTQVNSGPWVNATVGAELDGWSATINTPAAGSHFIRARAVQGGVTTAAVTQVLHVTA